MEKSLWWHIKIIQFTSLSINMKITVLSDFRNFKQGEEFDFTILQEIKCLVLVGNNGCGKTTLFDAIRGQNEDSKEKSLYSSERKMNSLLFKIEHPYEKIFFLDAVKDNGTNFMNAFDAVNYIDSGGHAKGFLSHGQGTLNDLSRFYNKIADKIIPNKTLIVLDEVDNGLSLKNQTLFRNFVNRLILSPLNCDILITSHNPFFILQSRLCYNLEDKKLHTSEKYIEAITGFKLIQNELP